MRLRIWFLPFSWAAYGLNSIEDGRWAQAAVYLFNLWALAAFCLSLVPLCANSFYLAYDRSGSSAGWAKPGKDHIAYFFDGLKVFSSCARAFLIKDIKFFMREPGLWLQSLVFFGILFIYFINFRRLSFDDMAGPWKNLILFLNMFSLLAVTAGMCVRFVFPQWSLEGKNFWILRLSPVSMARIFYEKFPFLDDRLCFCVGFSYGIFCAYA